MFYPIFIACLTFLSAAPFTPLTRNLHASPNHFFASIQVSSQSPFIINFPEKKDLTNDDYMEVQRQLRKIDVTSTIKQLYRQDYPELGYTTFGDFLGRCNKGEHLDLIDPARNFYPQRELVKIGRGGDRCVITYGSYAGKYPHFINSLAEGLKNVGFNGYFLYLIGGFPNPTGKEIKYAGVPYSFKIFLMVEAQRLGFTNVLWIDSACLPVRDITPLFDRINESGALLNWNYPHENMRKYIFPETRSLLKQLTGTDVLHSPYVPTGIFGLKMGTPECQEFVKKYYELADLGTPFLSCFPEEFVISAIMGQPQFQFLKTPSFHNLLNGSHKADSPAEYEKVRQQGFYFYHLKK